MPYTTKLIPKSVFRAYDIRGIINKELDENCFYTVGRTLAVQMQYLNRSQTFIARDGRLSSETLAKALQQGLTDSGITVLDLGQVATPVMYYATSTQAVDCGIIITGSHNPADYNGIKMVLAGKTLAQADIDKLYEIMMNKTYHQGIGNYQTFAIVDDYMQRIVNDIHLKRPLKIVVDCGNGIAGPVVPQVLRALGCEVITLFCEVDGRFPNHHPDPTVEANLSDLKRAVLEYNADIGLAFDGDADRLGVVTDKAETIWPDRLMMMYAQDILITNPGGTIVYDVKCSSQLSAVISKSNGRGKMCPTGHSIVKRVMREEQAILAGEMSGHIFFKQRWYGFDDALYSACRLLEILAKSNQSVSKQFSNIPNSINTPEIKIPIADEAKFDFMARFCRQAVFPEANLITVDGLRVEFEHGWGLLRASNTTPCLVARFEAKDEQNLETIKALFKAQLKFLDEQLELAF